MVRLTAQGTLDPRTTAGPEFDPIEVPPARADHRATAKEQQP
ncbi:hypothetical protein [Streptomyces sp. MNP-20]|nr:hypothetical protein [Streptomyces sp. MNP-20]